MKYLIMILLVSVLMMSACSSNGDATVDLIEEQPDDVVDEEVQEDILPELVDPDEQVEIGEMI